MSWRSSVGLIEVRDVHGNGIPMGMGIPWESHGNVNKTRKWEWNGREWETRSMGIGITCTPMGMHSDGNIIITYSRNSNTQVPIVRNGVKRGNTAIS